MVKPELTFVRNNSFSLWHRKLVDHWYMQDVDHTVWQIYDNQANTIALIEEKSGQIEKLDLNSFQFQALRKLARDIPVFVLLTHWNESMSYFSFYLVAANQPAKEFLIKAKQKDRRYLTESDYVRFESYLRKESPPLSKLDKASILLDKFPLPRIYNYDQTREA